MPFFTQDAATAVFDLPAGVGTERMIIARDIDGFTDVSGRASTSSARAAGSSQVSEGIGSVAHFDEDQRDTRPALLGGSGLVVTSSTYTAARSQAPDGIGLSCSSRPPHLCAAITSSPAGAPASASSGSSPLCAAASTSSGTRAHPTGTLSSSTGSVGSHSKRVV